MASAGSDGHAFHAAAIVQVILLAGCAALTVALPTAHRARRMPVAHLTQETAVGLTFARAFVSGEPYDDLVPGAEQGEVEYQITRRTWQQLHRRTEP